MKNKNESYLKVHIAVFLFGLTGLFGKFLTLNPFIIVLGRVFFSSIFIGIWMFITKESFSLKVRKDYKRLVIMGGLLAIHWTSFFAAIQFSNVAVGLLTFSTFPVFVSLFKPLTHQTKISFREILFGFITLIGITFIVPLHDLLSDVMIGAVIGMFSGAIYAIFTIYNEDLVKEYPGKVVAFYEQASATILLLPVFFIVDPAITMTDIGLLLLLGTVFTGIGHTLFISGLKSVSAYMAAIITMMEPLYSIVLAYFLLGEKVSINVFVGGSIILGSVMYLSLSEGKSSNKTLKETL